MKFKSPIGTLDIFTPQSDEVQALLVKFSDLVNKLGYKLIITPTFEDANLFKIGAGQTTDVVAKEMYEFEDKGGRNLALKPEGTASVMRAFIEHSYQVPLRSWYFTSAFRYESPQGGRYREHHQIGVEVLGIASYLIEVELIYILVKFYESIGLKHFTLLINSMGHLECRNIYRSVLLDYLDANSDQLCPEHTERYKINPLRVLDCKKPQCQNLVSEAPKLSGFLCDDCKKHHELVLEALGELKISYRPSDNLVRGFDYYSKTIFEFQSSALTVSQSAISGGGRYDNLVSNLGGGEVPGVGFGMGIERLLLALSAEGINLNTTPTYDIFIVGLASGFKPMMLVDKLVNSGFKVGYSADGGSFKSQLRQANKSGADVAVIIGESEFNSDSVTLKNLRDSSQTVCTLDVMVSELTDLLATIRE
jgi:histidyl-tRNA synthetase